MPVVGDGRSRATSASGERPQLLRRAVGVLEDGGISFEHIIDESGLPLIGAPQGFEERLQVALP